MTTSSSEPRVKAAPAEWEACQPWAPPEVAGQRPADRRRLDSRIRELFEQGFEQGRIQGFEQGRAEARAAVTGELESIVSALQAGLEALARPLSELDDEVEGQLVMLATTIARHVVYQQLSAEPERVAACVRAAIDALPAAAREVRLELNPEDISVVEAALGAVTLSAIRIAPNLELERGGCVLVSESSRVDATVRARLDAAIAHVLGGREPQTQPALEGRGP